MLEAERTKVNLSKKAHVGSFFTILLLIAAGDGHFCDRDKRFNLSGFLGYFNAFNRVNHQPMTWHSQDHRVQADFKTVEQATFFFFCQ